MKHILCGNPNVGKTTFLNALTNSNEHVGNWHGVTVDFLEKNYKLNNSHNIIVDLPGLYSLNSFSYEEQIARDYIFNSNENIINLVDANNLARNLYLTLELLELNKNLTLCINFANELKSTKSEIDIKKLSKLLGVNVKLINAQKKLEIIDVLNSSFKNNFVPPYLKDLPIQKVKEILGDKVKNINLNKNYIYLKALEQDSFIIDALNLSEDEKKELKKLECREKIIELRYFFIDKIICECVKKQSNKIYGYSLLDKIILNKFLSLPIFLVVIFCIFYLTFSSLGAFLSEILTKFLDVFINTPVLTLLHIITNSSLIISFFENGILTVFSTLASFLPQIVLLFLFLSILEDSGYLSRLAFVFEDILSLVGLNGRSVFSLLMGFGCNTTAALTGRTNIDKNSKIKTTMLVSYCSCTAKIPLYSVIIGAFFNNNIFIIFFLYFLGVLVALIISIILEKTILKTQSSTFIMEMPSMRKINVKRVFKLISYNILDFLKRISGVLFSFSIIIWLLQNLSTSFTFVSDPSTETSLLQFIGNILSPIFKPLGFGNSGAVCALICGVFAKEVIVSTMAIINNVSLTNGVNSLSQSFLNESSAIHFTPISAFSFLIFSLLYMPCISTISVYFSELGKKWAIFSISLQFCVAYLITFIFYKLLILFQNLNFISIFLSLVILLLIVVSVYYIFKIIKRPKIYCFGCAKCSSKCNKKCIK